MPECDDCEDDTLTYKGHRRPQSSRVGMYDLTKFETRVQNLDHILKIIPLQDASSGDLGSKVCTEK